ncbi:DUF4157 domain-containing protein [Paenibacillus mesophilus]|uniref:eCIS core domain-containing protein n=1 Tax=Paenibacillus mesophilus TaxID=2582849 RepID=UPI00110D5521|nr:DUF4157 domain-containing protein [Paenibacillus mesophilus]TMV51540.1 DUF4157 domain-containing protein [Paenibacillus mesophilus]
MTTRHTSIHRRPDGELTSKAKTNSKQSNTAEAHPVMQLQRSLGNKAIGSMLSAAQGAMLPAGVQAKLTVGPAGDAYEQEADQVGKMVADKISSSPDGGQSVQRDEIEMEDESEELQMKRAPEGIQRDEIEMEDESEELQMKRAPEGIQRDEIEMEDESEELQMKRAPEGIQRDEIEMEDESEELQMKRAPEGIQRDEIEMEDESEELQMKRSEEGFDADASLEQQIEQSRGNGSPMDTHVQAKMESAFDTGFSDVNVHTDAKADQMAQSIGASAFTTGSDIFFRQGQYNPGSRQGQELLGHELTHVVQQRGGNVPAEH